jgi:hypothetical protein
MPPSSGVGAENASAHVGHTQRKKELSRIITRNTPVSAPVETGHGELLYEYRLMMKPR